MNTEEREAMRAALEVLCMPCDRWNVAQNIKVNETIAKLRAALAQPRQEPVGIVGTMPGTNGFTMVTFKTSDVPVGTAIYTHPEPAERDAALVDAKRWRYARAGGTISEPFKARSPEETDAFVDENIALIAKEPTC